MLFAPDTNKDFVLDTDASGKAIAAILQQADEEGKLRVHMPVGNYMMWKHVGMYVSGALILERNPSVVTAIDNIRTVPCQGYVYQKHNKAEKPTQFVGVYHADFMRQRPTW